MKDPRTKILELVCKSLKILEQLQFGKACMSWFFFNLQLVDSWLRSIVDDAIHLVEMEKNHALQNCCQIEVVHELSRAYKSNLASL